MIQNVYENDNRKQQQHTHTSHTRTNFNSHWNYVVRVYLSFIAVHVSRFVYHITRIVRNMCTRPDELHR